MLIFVHNCNFLQTKHKFLKKYTQACPPPPMNDVIYESNLDTALGTVPRWHCCRTHLRGEKKAISRLINLIFSLLLAVGRISELSQLLPFTTAPSLEKSQSTIHPTSPKKQYFEQLNPFLQAAKRDGSHFPRSKTRPHIMIHI